MANRKPTQLRTKFEFGWKIACVKERFAKCVMRMEKVSVHDFGSDIGM